MSPATARLLEGTGWEAPAAASLPYGAELVHDYVLQLAATEELAPRDTARLSPQSPASAHRPHPLGLLPVTNNGIGSGGCCLPITGCWSLSQTGSPLPGS